IGRTGRAGREGRAFTLTTDAEDKLVDAIEKITGRVIERHPPRATAASSGKPRAASEQSAAEERAGEDRQQKTVEGETGERAAPKRARRTRKPAAAATEAQESASPAARDADEKLDAASEASAGDRRGDDEPVRERGGRPARAGSRGTGKESTERSGRRRRDADGDRPVVGMGDHMPAFLLRPVPLKASVSEGPIDGA
ncbi:MAG: hypothetical protein KDE35_13890, partial [Geminicoccaceae bacterium]|nr:hypothetical protein [Geminicoccaceae bacterium]